MTGGTFCANYNTKTGTFTPATIEDAWLNITYNYSRYYYVATENDDRFYGEKDYGDREYGNLGIRGLYGKTGLESIAMLNDMISSIESKYKKDGEWINSRRRTNISKDKHGKECHPVELLLHHEEKYTEEQVEMDVYEGPNEDYWIGTAANALKPLYQLKVYAELRPDGIWTGD
jgi:hypothetical protein